MKYIESDWYYSKFEGKLIITIVLFLYILLYFFFFFGQAYIIILTQCNDRCLNKLVARDAMTACFYCSVPFEDEFVPLPTSAIVIPIGVMACVVAWFCFAFINIWNTVADHVSEHEQPLCSFRFFFRKEMDNIDFYSDTILNCWLS